MTVNSARRKEQTFVQPTVRLWANCFHMVRRTRSAEVTQWWHKEEFTLRWNKSPEHLGAKAEAVLRTTHVRHERELSCTV